ncbi:hypothetical protein [Pseudanabaena sp. PCC 6802]|uniref:hypothetical protein n=1 Tax=Pseudanabaena sp. PCC 6802 TaxID=118173 RepID=UPI000369A714|nr:hypothetical protein [Pseudanabaena sp. PCC 6802]
MRSRQLPSQAPIQSEVLAIANANANPADVSEAILRRAIGVTGIKDFNIRTEGRVIFNGGGDLDGEPLDLKDDTHIYARGGFSFNNTPVLPVQRDSAGNPIRDANGRQVLVKDAVDVSAGFTANAPNNPYSNRPLAD